MTIIFVAIGQQITFYDVLSNHNREKEYLRSAVTAVKNSSSTKIVLGNLPSELPRMTVCSLSIIWVFSSFMILTIFIKDSISTK